MQVEQAVQALVELAAAQVEPDQVQLVADLAAQALAVDQAQLVVDREQVADQALAPGQVLVPDRAQLVADLAEQDLDQVAQEPVAEPALVVAQAEQDLAAALAAPSNLSPSMPYKI